MGLEATHLVQQVSCSSRNGKALTLRRVTSGSRRLVVIEIFSPRPGPALTKACDGRKRGNRVYLINGELKIFGPPKKKESRGDGFPSHR